MFCKISLTFYIFYEVPIECHHKTVLNQHEKYLKYLYRLSFIQVDSIEEKLLKRFIWT